MVTGKDIAEATGFALSTVEKVLRGHCERYKINPKTAETIRDTAERMGYHRSEAAVITRTGVNHAVAIFVPVLPQMHAVLSMIISGVMAEAALHDYSATLFNSYEDPEKNISAVLSKRIGKVIYIGDRISNGRLCAELCRRNDISLVFASEGPDGPWPLVRTDDRAGTRMGIEHLAAMGHRRIGVITGAYYPERVAGVHEGFAATALSLIPEFTLVHTPDIVPEELMKRLEQMLDAPNRPTAFSCVTDDVAMMLMQLAYKKGIRVPEELSIVGYGNAYRIVEYAMMPLTTVAQPFHEVGRTAFKVVAGVDPQLVETAEHCFQVPTTLLIRNSVADRTKRKEHV